MILKNYVQSIRTQRRNALSNYSWGESESLKNLRGGQVTLKQKFKK